MSRVLDHGSLNVKRLVEHHSQRWQHVVQATLPIRLRAINVPLRQASKGHSRPPVAAKLAGNQAHTHEFKQFPS
jgi:hypothetical protein